MYCKKCGGKVDSYASNCPFCGEPVANNNVQATYRNDASGGEVKSVGSWILTYIIMCLPLVGFIMLFVWAFGKGTLSNRTFRNWARAFLLIQLIAYVLSIGLLVAVALLYPELLSELMETYGSAL